MNEHDPIEQAMLREDRREGRIYHALSALAGVDTHDINLRDHSDAWAILEQLLEDERND